MTMDILRDNLDYMIFGVLGLMSFFMLWFVIERYFYYARVNVENFNHVDNLNVALTNNLTIDSDL